MLMSGPNSGSRDGRGRGPESDELERLVGRAMSAPQADPAFRAQLRQRLARGLGPAEHGTAAGEEKRNAMRRTYAGKHVGARRLGRWGMGLAVAALAGGLVLGLWPALTGEQMAAFGPLPPPVSGFAPSLGAAGGPGFTFNFTYRLGGTLGQDWPALGDREQAYLLTPFDFTEAHVSGLAARLGIGGPVVREGWQDSYLLAVESDQRALRAFPVGYVVFTQPYDYPEVSRSELPTDARALVVARDWLAASGFVSDIAQLGPGVVTYDSGTSTLLVKFRPVEPADVVTIAPWAQVQVGVGEAIVMGSADWYPVVDSSPYPLRGVQAAWETVRAGQGILQWAITEYPGPSGDSEVVLGDATATGVRLAWAIGRAADGTPYLVPVYAFTGTVEVPYGAEALTTTLPFEVWAPAVAEEHAG